MEKVEIYKEINNIIKKLHDEQMELLDNMNNKELNECLKNEIDILNSNLERMFDEENKEIIPDEVIKEYKNLKNDFPECRIGKIKNNYFKLNENEYVIVLEDDKFPYCKTFINTGETTILNNKIIENTYAIYESNIKFVEYED